MAFFTYAGSKYAEAPITASIIIAASQTVHIGGWINAVATSGNADAADAAEALIGVCTEITTKDGIPLGAHAASEIDGTWTPQSGSTAATYVASASNATGKQVKVLVNIDPSAMYYNTPDATINTTTGSGILGYYTDIASDTQADEDTAATSTCQLLILGLNPQNSAQGMYMKHESQI